MHLKQTLRKSYVNFRGWSTKKKYLIIESDDWGSIRMPSKKAYDILLKKGVSVSKSNYTKYDCLESNQDIENLFETLTSIKDSNGKPAVITANALVANPDFDKIEKSNKKEYYFEEISETYLSYPNHDNVLKMWRDIGIKENLLFPQFHGREHFNVNKWMKAINAGIIQENLAFENCVLLGLGDKGIEKNVRDKLQYMAALECDNEEEKKQVEIITAEGLSLFNKTFGFDSTSFVATASVRGNHIDKVLSDNGVKFHQCGQQFIPLGNGKTKKVNKYWGDKNKYGQIYWRRNATFEPSRNQNLDSIDSCLAEIEIAFRFGKPAVINTHRVNFSGGISEKNRDLTLFKLKELLKKVVSKWPDVQFINSAQLGKVLTGEEFN